MTALLRLRVVLGAILLVLVGGGATPPAGPKSLVMTAMEQELERTWKEVKRDPDAPLHYNARCNPMASRAP